MNRRTTIVVFGLVVVSAFFWLPAVLMFCAELLCGGVFGIVASITIAVAALALLVFSFKKIVRAWRKRVNDPVLQGTAESVVIQNARYIENTRAEGFDDDAIREVLLGAGWGSNDVTAAFARVEQGNLY